MSVFLLKHVVLTSSHTTLINKLLYYNLQYYTVTESNNMAGSELEDRSTLLVK